MLCNRINFRVVFAANSSIIWIYNIGTTDSAQSRGYGFVEFQHHGHALACLRQLNNNPGTEQSHSEYFFQ